MTLTGPHPFSPEYSYFTNFPSKIPFHYRETIKQLPFKIKLPKVADEPSQVSFIPWSKTEQRTIKNFLNLERSPKSFFEEFRVTVWACDLGPPDRSAWPQSILHLVFLAEREHDISESWPSFYK